MTTPPAAVRASILSGVLFLLCCVAFGASAGQTAVVAAVILVLATSLQVAGELWQAAGSFVSASSWRRTTPRGSTKGSTAWEWASRP